MCSTSLKWQSRGKIIPIIASFAGVISILLVLMSTALIFIDPVASLFVVIAIPFFFRDEGLIIPESMTQDFAFTAVLEKHAHSKLRNCFSSTAVKTKDKSGSGIIEFSFLISLLSKQRSLWIKIFDIVFILFNGIYFFLFYPPMFSP